MKAVIIPTFVTTLILLRASSAEAASIGVSFLGDSSNGDTAAWRLEPSDMAGVVPQAHWNNIGTPGWGAGQAPAGGILSDPLLESGGNVTSVQLHLAGNDAWNSDGPTDTPDDKLMKGILKEGTTGTSMTLTFTNLPAGSYDLYVYGNVNGGPVDLDVSVGAKTNHWSEPAAFDDGTGFVDASDPNNGGAGNYVKFGGVTPNNGAITAVATYLGGSDGLGIAGLQLVTTSTFPPNTAAVGIAVQPQAQLASPGGAVIFSVTATGPGPKYQWLKNGAPIAGATNSTYSTPALTLNDNATKFKVTVSNNVNSVTSDEVVLTVMNDPGTRTGKLGVSFLGNTGDRNVEAWRMASADTAGVVPQANWNNLQWDDWGNVGAPAGGFVGVSGALVDSAGNLTGVLLRANCNDAWNADGPTDTANDRLMKGILKEGGVGSSMTLGFTNLAQGTAFVDVYVYGNVNGGPVELDVQVGGTTKYWTEPAAFDDGTGFAESNSSDSSARAEGNYVKFTGIGVTPQSGVLITATYRGGSDGLGIAGVQIVSSAAFPTNAVPVSIIGQPTPTLAAPGSAATFRVEAGGPVLSLQWFKNGAAIPGATNSSYTTGPLTLNDTGAKFKVTIGNNVNSVTSDEVALTVMNDPGTRVASIGASFLGDGSAGVEEWRMAPSDSAGVVVQTNWNNIASTPTGNVGLSEPLLDAAGNLTPVQLQFVANDAWNSDGPIETANDKLMKGVIKEGGAGSSMTLTFTNLPPAFYDLYVYGNVNGGPVNLDVSIGATLVHWSEPGAFDDGSGFIDASNPANGGSGNYVKFAGITPAGGGITVTATYLDGSDGLGIAGLQLVSSAPLLPSNPKLAAALQGANIVISWTSSANFQLQSRTDLGQGSWSDETTPPVVNGNQKTVTLPTIGPARFFRLVSR